MSHRSVSALPRASKSHSDVRLPLNQWRLTILGRDRVPFFWIHGRLETQAFLFRIVVASDFDVLIGMKNLDEQSFPVKLFIIRFKLEFELSQTLADKKDRENKALEGS